MTMSAVMTLVHALRLGLAALLIAVPWTVLSLWRQARRERKLAVAERRAEARALKAAGYDAMPSWTITSPTHPVLRDPHEDARLRESRRRRALGEF